MCCFAQLNKPKGVCPVCGCDNAAISNEAHQLDCGSILAGTYLIGKVLGQGGFGITYIGWDLNLDIKVAIKEYYPEGCVTRDAHTHISVLTYAGAKEAYFQKGKERFVNEARALAKFPGDSGVVGVRTFFYENGTAYIVMDFVEGETLKSYAQRRGGRLPAAEVLELFQPIFRSLARVHDSGLLHRDISPDNLMLKTDGMLALLDFGAARQMSTEGEHSNTINVKHGFAPEEQYRTRGEQGPWTDVYALCATIYRLTTGRTPPEALDRMADGTLLTPPNQLGADFTPAQEAAIIHGLAVRASDRTRDVRQLEKELYGGERTVFAASPVSVSFDPAAPTAPQSSFVTPPLSRSVEPAAPAAPQSSFVTQPLSVEAEPAAPTAPQSSFVTPPLSRSVEPAAPTAPQSSFVTQPLSRSVEPAAPAVPQSSFVTQPLSVEAEPAKNGVSSKAENIIGTGSSGAQNAAASGGTPPDDSAQQEVKPKKANQARTIATYIAVAAMFIWTVFGTEYIVGPIGFVLFSSDAVCLIWLCFKMGVFKRAKEVDKKERTASIAVLSGSGLMLVLLIAIIISIYGVPSASATAQSVAAASRESTTVIEWKDPTIEAGIRTALGKSEGEAITTGDVAYIYDLRIAGDTLYVNDESVWPDVNTYDNTYSVDYGSTYLPISDQTISLADLANFSGLTTLKVYAVNVSGLESLKFNTSLSSISLVACGDIDLSAFEGYVGLMNVSLSDCNAVSMSGSADNLTFIFLGINNCKQFSTNILVRLKTLIGLELLNTGISDLSFLKNMNQLTSLNISGEEIADITPIASLTNLQSLMLQNLSITDISALRSLTMLNSIMFYNVPISDISVLSGMKKLNSFDCYNTNISDFSPLQDLPIMNVSTDKENESTLKKMFPWVHVWVNSY
jgi:serine/threonine protein kinase